MRTAQELFDQSVNHLRQQRRQSIGNHTCLYFDPCTFYKCAVGCLIPKKDYSRKFEGHTIRELVNDNLLPEELCLEFGDNLELLLDLQSVHDDKDDVSSWEESWKSIAGVYGLIYTPIAA